MKKIVAFLVAVIGAVQATSAYASNFQGTVTNVFAYNGTVFIAMSGSGSGCASNGSAVVFSIDPNTAFGRTLVSVALSAKVTGLLVYAAGSGACVAGNPFSGGASETLLGLDLKG